MNPARVLTAEATSDSAARRENATRSEELHFSVRWLRSWELSASVLVAWLAFALEVSLPCTLNAAVFYVAALLFVARKGHETEIFGFGAFIGLLSVISFVIAYDVSLGRRGLLSPVAEVFAIGTATFILARCTRERWASNWRYRSIFKRSRFPLFELDFSQASAMLAGMKRKGVTSIAEHSSRNPDFLPLLKEHIRIVDMNDAMFVHFGLIPGAPAMPNNLASMIVDDGQLLEILQAVLEGGEHYDGIGRTTRIDGKSVDVCFSLSIDSYGLRTGSAIGMLVDVSEKEEANKALAAARAELARASRVAAVGTVSASIAHELNQPIGAILLNAQTCMRYLRRTTPDLEAALSAAQRVVREGDRAAEIVRETRDLIAKRRNRHEPLDLAISVKEAAELARREIEKAGASLHVNMRIDEAFILGDRVALQQALINLLLNAQHAVGEQPWDRRHVVISLTQDGREAVVSVSDSGKGIEEKDLERIFDSFFTTKEGGTGMGLSISRSAIEAHGGSLKARNQERGGALFECRVPLWIKGDKQVESSSCLPMDENGRSAVSQSFRGLTSQAVRRMSDTSIKKKPVSNRAAGYVVGTGI